ncbi:MAG: response regulator [Crocinitomix sp.]|nr:response regulator [Crocinitomix sp.]
MSLIRIYIVEDEPLITETIRVCLIKEGFDVVGDADNIGDAFFEIDELQPDLVFIDITLDGEQRGIDLGKKLNSKTTIPFIYLTSHSDKSTVLEASDTNPSGYLLKPFKSKNLKVAIDFALSKIILDKSAVSLAFLFVKKNKNWVKIEMSEILIAKADDTYTEIYTEDEKFLISQPLKKIEKKLGASFFKRAHRTYVVNINKIAAIEDDLLVIGKHLVPVGKTYKKDLLACLNFL